MREFNVGDTVRHFDYEKDINENYIKYLYTIIEFAVNTSRRNERFVIYKNVYNGLVFATPFSDFCKEVDKTIHKNIKQEYCFEKVSI